jgi:hypothetical protein
MSEMSRGSSQALLRMATFKDNWPSLAGVRYAARD